MNHTDETLAWLLAAEDHPHLKNEAEYDAAKSQLDASPELHARFEEALAFNLKHPSLFSFGTMPPDVRRRISTALEESAPPGTAPVESLPAPSPWSYRQQFAWAAVLALFLAGLSVLSSRIIEQQSPYAQPHRAEPPRLAGNADALPEFHRFVKNSLDTPPRFQHQARDTVQLVSWLKEHDGFASPLPDSITRAPGMGCAILESPHGDISMICVDLNGQKLKLFIACSKALRVHPRPVEALRIENHEALEWSNDDNLFLLIQSEPDTPMPEIML
ncbi:MAG: anti-sigma factor [Verrucomicrobia bacterium]|nr:anti-sigma factor [Verrucomicrobiota bacterium]MCH8527759.1 anti-sigma factor [Kiritimatiellia bacterium]